MQLAWNLFRGGLKGLKTGLIVAVLLLVDCLVIQLLFGGGGNASLSKDFAPVKPPATLMQFLIGLGCLVALGAVTVAGTYIGYCAWQTAWGMLIGGACAYALAWTCFGAMSRFKATERQ